MDDRQLEKLEPGEPDRSRHHWQFSLWWLFLLTTATAAIAGLMRQAAGDYVSMALVTYLAVIAIYLIVRVPMLIYASAELRRIRDDRQKLSQWAKWKRDEQRATKVSREP